MGVEVDKMERIKEMGGSRVVQQYECASCE